MANVDNANGFSYERRVGGGPGTPLEEGTTLSNGTIATGDALAVSGGLLLVATTTHTAVHGVAAESITGATGVRQQVAFYPALPDVIFSGQFDGDATESDLGLNHGIVGSTGAQELDTTGTDTSVAQIVGLKHGSTWDSNARVLFIWAKSSFGRGNKSA